MTLWIRIDANIGENPNVWKLAGVRGLSANESVGLLVVLFGKVAEHCPHGNVSDVPDALLERWAGWTGEPGAFATSFRELFVSDGVVEGWEKRQGKLVERAEKERQRAAARRAADSTPKVRGQSANESAARNGTVRNEEKSSAAAAEDSPPPAVKRIRPVRPPAPWMGKMNAAWKAEYGGNLPAGSATLLAPVVFDVGEDEAANRLARYCEATAPEFASVRTFASKHGAFAPKLAVDPATGLMNAAGLKAWNGGRP